MMRPLFSSPSPSLPSPSLLSQVLAVRRASAVASRYAGLLRDEVDGLLLMGARASVYGPAFAEHFRRVVLFERDDALCARFRARRDRHRGGGNWGETLILVDSQTEGEAILRTVAERFAIIDCGGERGGNERGGSELDGDGIGGGDIDGDKISVTDTMRRADYIVLPGSIRAPERGATLVEALDARGPNHEFNVGNAWEELPKFTDWQRRAKFKDRMAAQYRAYSIHARQARRVLHSGWG